MMAAADMRATKTTPVAAPNRSQFIRMSLLSRTLKNRRASWAKAVSLRWERYQSL
jgi:hypothetical protein